jgi:hypothetical protein
MLYLREQGNGHHQVRVVPPDLGNKVFAKVNRFKEFHVKSSSQR